MRSQIPAMTTDAERECYYRLVKEHAHMGAVVELGPWLGASTAYIAKGMRDAGVSHKAQVYDRFKLHKDHLRKVKAWNANHGGSREVEAGPCLDEFKANLGQLMDHVEPHPGEIAELNWGSEPISVLICDAPKRVAVISSVLTKFRKALQPGSIMAWQDFCHFPSYEIPACLYRLRDHIEFVEAVVPGTTMVFRVKSQWTADEVSLEALALSKWNSGSIEDAWDYWLDFIPDEKVGLFLCGEALFLCDIGEPEEAVQNLTGVFAEHRGAITKKWRYLYQNRPDYLTRYAPLFDYLERQGVFEKEPA